MSEYFVSTFYALKALDADAQQGLLQPLQAWPIGEPPLRGLVLIAPDGMNATIAGSQTAVLELEEWFRGRLPLSMCKHSRCEGPPFGKWKVVLRKQTITGGDIQVAPQPRARDSHLSAEEWQRVLDEESVVLIDVRNDYEVRLGKFRGAVNPTTNKFSDFADFVAAMDISKEQKILTYCTGGIRCEKAVPYLEDRGFTNVFQLEGGILNYLEHFPDRNFEGECFVFDERVSLDQQLQPTRQFRRCPECGQPGGEECHYCS